MTTCTALGEYSVLHYLRQTKHQGPDDPRIMLNKENLKMVKGTQKSIALETLVKMVH